MEEGIINVLTDIIKTHCDQQQQTFWFDVGNVLTMQKYIWKCVVYKILCNNLEICNNLSSTICFTNTGSKINLYTV
jgi:hypothetical protein